MNAMPSTDKKKIKVLVSFVREPIVSSSQAKQYF
jgi:hypothetical protein